MKSLRKKVSLNNPKRTRLKFSTIAMIIGVVALGFFSYISFDQYMDTGDISAGVGSIVGGVLIFMGGVVQIYSNYETRRPSQNISTIVQVPTMKRLPPDFEDEGDDEPIPQNII
jgi:small neutral amino acid transporter SnatA (MarC family)